MYTFYLFSTVVFFFVCILYYFITKKHNYWKKRNVPYINPSLFFGNYKDYITLRKYSPKITQEICQQFPNSPYVGVYYGTDPALVLQDPDIIKLVIAKDFYYFNSREVQDHTHKELITQNMFFTGGDRWKVLRQNLTALFSSAKLKNMFHLIENCATQLDKAIDEDIKSSKTNVIEIKSLLARYTMDCIGSCAFGVDTGTLAAQDGHKNPFTIMGEKLFDVTNSGALKMISRAMWPAAFYGLGLKWFSDDIVTFFNQLLRGVFNDRSYKQSPRNDFVDFVLGWKQKNNLTGDSVSNFKTGLKTTVTLEVNDDLLVAQCILFFAAGFETTATTTSFVFYELAKHPRAQARVIEEVVDYFHRHNGKIEYDCINEMPYLQACIDETLRLYPVLGVLTREVVESYTLPTGLRLEKGDRVHIPVYHIHHDPRNFPEPEEFRPERFYGEAKKNIKPFTYIPFGEGPRICIGLRFARMPIVAGLLTILKKYRVEVPDDMPRNIEFQPRAFVAQAMGGTLTVEEVYKDRDQFAGLVREVAAPDVGRMGIEILSFTIKDVYDDVQYLASLGKAQTAAVKRDADIGVAQANRDAGIQEAECEKTAMDVKYAMDTRIEDNARMYKLQKAQFDQEVNTAKAESALAYELQAAKIKQKIRNEEIQIEVVERRKQIEVEQQEIMRREEELIATVRLPAEAEAYRLQTIAEGKRTQTVEAAKADGERIKVLGLAEAHAIGDVGKADAERMLAKAKVYKQYGDAAIMALVLEALPKIAAEISAPLAKTDEIVLVGDNGSTGEVARLAGAIPPAVRTLTGLDLTQVLKRLHPSEELPSSGLKKKEVTAC